MSPLVVIIFIVNITMRTVLAIFVMIFSLSALADDSWSESDRKLAYSAGTLLVMDWHTTRTLAEHGWCAHKCFETNPLLGRYPTSSAVDRHFALSPLIFIVADQFPEYRHIILMGTVIVEAVVVTNNIVRFGWTWQF
jgi:hypothetical protein